MRKFFRSGEPFIWLTGSALAASLLLVAALLGLLLLNGTGLFWPKKVVLLTLQDGRKVAGEITERETIPQPDAPAGTAVTHRIKLKQGNRDLYGTDFLWIDEADIVSREAPEDAVVIERLEWGNWIGFLKTVKDGERIAAEGPDASYAKAQSLLPSALATNAQIREIETEGIGAVSARQEELRLYLKDISRRGIEKGPKADGANAELARLQARFQSYEDEITELRSSLTARLIAVSSDGSERDIPLSKVVRIYRPNQMGFSARVGFYFQKLWEFLSADPRESNTEGGIFPAIFGTVVMVFFMTLIVTPFGVVAAVYLREYARQGPLVSAVRIAVNNLAGVPSIVFGVFGVAFFIYGIGGSIDRLFFSDALPTPTFGTGGLLWASLTLALLTVPVVIVATEEGLAAIPTGLREGALALGATKFETTWRVVLPTVIPSLLTGVILAIARAAGEVAPLMITGVVKLAPALPLDGHWPFLHLERKFMHLGFHIYDVGFQSPNVDAARPMVYATALLLLAIVVSLNWVAIVLRNRLRKRFALSAV